MRLERDVSYSPHARPEAHYIHENKEGASADENKAVRSPNARWNKAEPESWQWVQ